MGFCLSPTKTVETRKTDGRKLTRSDVRRLKSDKRWFTSNVRWFTIDVRWLTSDVRSSLEVT
jgi:hypothetical protein